jgi:hypothetical protein
MNQSYQKNLLFQTFPMNQDYPVLQAILWDHLFLMYLSYLLLPMNQRFLARRGDP